MGVAEGELLRRYLDRGDEEAFRAIVDRHGPMVLGVCRRVLGGSGDAEDAFQVTFLTLSRKAESLVAREAIGPWLQGVACRVALRARTAAARRRSREANSAAPDVAEADDPAGREAGSVLDEELARLPHKYRAPLVLCYLDGLTHEEAGQRLGWPVGSVKGRLARGREVLKGRLSRRGMAPAVGPALAGLEEGFRASVPRALADRATRAGVAFAAGRAAGVFPATAAASFRWGVAMMFGNPWKTTALALSTLGAGAAVLAYQAPKAPSGPGRSAPAAAGGVEATKPAEAAGTPASWPAMAEDHDTSPRSKAIRDGLTKSVAMPFGNETPLDDLLKHVKENTKSPEIPDGIPIYVDPQGLLDSDKTMADTISMDIQGVPLRTTLTLALKQLSLCFKIKDGLLIVASTNSEDAETPLSRAMGKADRGELTRAEYQELTEILKLRQEALRMGRDVLPGPSGFQ